MPRKKHGRKVKRSSIQVWDAKKKHSESFGEKQLKVLEKALDKKKIYVYSKGEQLASQSTLEKTRKKARKIGADFEIEYSMGVRGRIKETVPLKLNQIRGIAIILKAGKPITEKTIREEIGAIAYKIEGWKIARGSSNTAKISLIKKLGTPEMDVLIKKAKELIEKEKK